MRPFAGQLEAEQQGFAIGAQYASCISQISSCIASMDLAKADLRVDLTPEGAISSSLSSIKLLVGALNMLNVTHGAMIPESFRRYSAKRVKDLHMTHRNLCEEVYKK